MKKLLALLIAMALVTALTVSCGDKQKSGQDGVDSAVGDELIDDTLGEIFKEASEIGDGTAGVSLKRAGVAARIASYAALIGYTEDAADSLKEKMLADYEKLDDQGKENLDNTINNAIYLLDKVIVEGDYDSVKGLFEDAGVAEGLDAALKAPGLKESYNTFKTADRAMGKSED